MSRFKISILGFSLLGLLALMTLGSCMGSPGGGTGPTFSGGFTGNPPPGPTPNISGGNPAFLVSSGGTISSSVHLYMRASFGEAPGAVGGTTTVATSPNFQLRASLQPTLNDSPGL